MDAEKKPKIDIPGKGLMVTDYYFHFACFAQSSKIKVEFSKIDSIRDHFCLLEYKCVRSSRPMPLMIVYHSGMTLSRNI